MVENESSELLLTRPDTPAASVVAAIMSAAFAYYEATGSLMLEIAIPPEHFEHLTAELGFQRMKSSIPPALVDHPPMRSGLDVVRVQREVAIRVNGVYVWPGRRRM